MEYLKNLKGKLSVMTKICQQCLRKAQSSPERHLCELLLQDSARAGSA